MCARSPRDALAQRRSRGCRSTLNRGAHDAREVRVRCCLRRGELEDAADLRGLAAGKLEALTDQRGEVGNGGEVGVEGPSVDLEGVLADDTDVRAEAVANLVDCDGVAGADGIRHSEDDDSLRRIAVACCTTGCVKLSSRSGSCAALSYSAGANSSLQTPANAADVPRIQPWRDMDEGYAGDSHRPQPVW